MLKKITQLFQSQRQNQTSSSRGDRKRQSAKKPVHPFACVEIKTRFDHCSAIEPFCGKRLLTGEAPWLPLPDCTCENCRCSYIRFNDRRSEKRRDADEGIMRREYMGENRRSHIRGRRQADLTTV